MVLRRLVLQYRMVQITKSLHCIFIFLLPEIYTAQSLKFEKHDMVK